MCALGDDLFFMQLQRLFTSIGILGGWRQDVKRDPSVLRRNMKSLRSVARLVPVVAVSVALLCGLAAAAESGPTLSKKELKTLLATAQTPSDHQKIAAYYSDQAKRLNAKAQEFSAQADVPMPRSLQRWNPSRGFRPCPPAISAIGQSVYAQEAKDSEALATQHDEVAKRMSPAGGLVATSTQK